MTTTPLDNDTHLAREVTYSIAKLEDIDHRLLKHRLRLGLDPDKQGNYCIALFSAGADDEGDDTWEADRVNHETTVVHMTNALLPAIATLQRVAKLLGMKIVD